jgi:small nuclear ribonucleoprotein
MRVGDVLLKRLGKVIIVEYDGGNNLRGKLVRFDGHLNLLLEETHEITTLGEVNFLGSVLLRGSNVVLILASITEMVF